MKNTRLSGIKILYLVIGAATALGAVAWGRDQNTADSGPEAILVQAVRQAPPMRQEPLMRLRPLYRLTDVGSIDGAEDAGLALNSRAEIAFNDGGKGYVWRAGRRTQLPTVTGMPNLTVTGINDQGGIVGGVSVTTSGAITRTDGTAIFWSHGKAVSLGSLPDLGDAAAAAMNSRGQIVGSSSSDSFMEFQDTMTGVTHVFLWDQGKMTDLGEGAAAGLNDAGQIVGTVSFTEAQSNGYTTATHAALWDRGKRQDLGTLPGWTFSAATSINSSGAVVGDCYNGMEQEPSEAFLWRAGRMRDLGPGRALAINAGGQIVGVSGGRAVLWRGGSLCDLNTCLRGAPGWVLTSADGINNRGQIAGVGTRHGQSHAFLLTPISSSRLALVSAPLQTAQMHLVAAATGGDEIILYWQGVPGVIRYNVYRTFASASAARRVNRAPVQTRDPGVANGWTYTDQGLKNDVSYVYTVAALSSRGQEIARSNPSQAAPDANAPPWDSRNVTKIAAQVWKNAQGADMPDDDFGPTLPPSPQDFVAPDGVAYRDPSVYVPPSPYRYDAHPAIAYDAAEVGGLSRVFEESLSLNAGGAVTGSVQPPGDTRPALPFVWQNGAMQLLPVPPSESPYGFTSGINAAGLVCGRGNTLGRRQTALVWSGGAVHILPPLPGGGHCAAYGIGDGGQVVGGSAGATGQSHMVVWDPGGHIHDLGLGRLTGINAAGQVVGTQSGTLARRDHAVLGQNGVLHDLGTLGGPFSTGRAINNRGDAAGWSNVAHGGTRGFLYMAGHMINLGLPPGGISSHANALNNADVIVGSAATQTGRIALIWRLGTLADLNALTVLPPGVTLVDATAVNDRGQICAIGRIGNTTHAYLLTPHLKL